MVSYIVFLWSGLIHRNNTWTASQADHFTFIDRESVLFNDRTITVNVYGRVLTACKPNVH